MVSVTEAELGGLFKNCQKDTSMWISLSEMVHSQPPTPVAITNKAENSIVNETKKNLEQYTWGIGKGKPGGLCHKKTTNMLQQNYETKIFETNNIRYKKN